MSHTRWKALRERQLTEPAEVTEARREIRLSMALAQAVYDRRTELGLTQAELGERAGLTQAKISRIEGSDTDPTLPLLAKLAAALDATLNIALDADDTQVSFTSRHTSATRARPFSSDLALPQMPEEFPKCQGSLSGH
ncbi:helix-turn-helix domain-containing protein [Nocardia sp. FBN12]|uniref:helix-turn-helix domain-containing protein n=1 Tax=Nocardia sp. FBN12 TaxID=3419766 RepID=UPI003D04C25E